MDDLSVRGKRSDSESNELRSQVTQHDGTNCDGARRTTRSARRSRAPGLAGPTSTRKSAPAGAGQIRLAGLGQNHRRGHDSRPTCGYA